MSFSLSDSSQKCGLCANVLGVYPYRFYNFFNDCINGVKINEVMSNMFPYGDYSRDSMNSELICQCCHKQAVEMSRRDTKWVDCFKQMDAIKNKFPHLRGRNDFDYFLSSTASRPSTSLFFTGNQYRSTLPSTSFTGNQYQPTSSSAPSRSFTGNQYRPHLPSTSFTRNQDQPTSSSAPSTSFTRNQDQPTSSSAASTSFTRNQYRPTLPSTSFTGNQYQPTSSSASSRSFTENQYRPISSTSFTRNQTSSAPSTIVSGSIHNEDNSDNYSNSSGSSTTVSENENNEEYSSMMMASTHNTCIDIMSNRVYSKAGAYYSCIIPSCREFYKTFHKLKMHYRHHRNVNGIMCWSCLKVYPNMSELRKHKFQDSCKFPGMFVCVVCNKSFNDLQSISHHKYIKHIINN